MSEKHTPGEAAWTEFSAVPLVLAAGADRASFIAGYETAAASAPDLKAERDRLKAENAELVKALERYMTGHPCNAQNECPTKNEARAVLAKRGG